MRIWRTGDSSCALWSKTGVHFFAGVESNCLDGSGVNHEQSSVHWRQRFGKEAREALLSSVIVDVWQDTISSGKIQKS